MSTVWRFFDASFRRYAATSALATTADFALASSLHSLGSPAPASTFLGCVAGGGVAFTLSRGWTFQAGTGPATPQLARFLFVWLASAALNSLGVATLVGFASSFPLAWVATRATVYLGWNYPMARWFVFARDRRSLPLSVRP